MGWKKGKKHTFERVLCGGTNFDAPTEYVNQRDFDGHIVLTDMEAPKPKPSKCQRMWATTHNTQSVHVHDQRAYVDHGAVTRSPTPFLLLPYSPTPKPLGAKYGTLLHNCDGFFKDAKFDHDYGRCNKCNKNQRKRDRKRQAIFNEYADVQVGDLMEWCGYMCIVTHVLPDKGWTVHVQIRCKAGCIRMG